MIDADAVAAMLDDAGMAAWAGIVGAQLRQVLVDAPHGDWPRWHSALDALPVLGPGAVAVADGALSLSPHVPPGAAAIDRLREQLLRLRPWRKGPYRIAGLLVDSEWRSNLKWDRVAPHLQSLDGRRVLDVGCGNGYYAWRMALAGARQVVGVDPTALFLAQFAAIRRLVAPMEPALAARVEILPLGIEAVPRGLGAFDTVFSMGVMYHRRSPIDHLVELRGALRRGGQLVLETLVVDGGADRVLVPPRRYAKMRNVWFIPAVPALETWLRRAGFGDVSTVDVSVTEVTEQRATPWMTFESLADFLDPADSGLTVEGHPAPRRAIVVATA
ncbi:MAG: tRNA 5-methoxyuridine(34)/uridine 5-oxyacetic acid(34) synthase CmoB [Gammaproteobacteria bacterium]|nr:tRNA 5-methoxyuridine(34)/uridine 5-oxyacetic acid(34) synthase CmoB [Gammaproteobacteria bacterium]